MIKKILIITFGILIAYFCLIHFFCPGWKPLRSLWQHNVVIGEDYIYENTNKKIVLVGSSLGFTIDNNYLPENFYNLSLSGLSSFSGLDIIKKADAHPEIILIEINHFERFPDKSLSEKMFSPYSYYSKKYFDVLREKNNSYSLLFGPLISKTGKFILSGGKSSENEMQVKPINKKVFNLRLNKAFVEFNKLNDESLLLKNIKLLKNFENYFQSKNTKIGFYEMPMDSTLSNSIMLNQTRKVLYSNFPPDRYLYIKLDNTEGYQTSDGKHLNELSAQKFAKFLINTIKKNHLDSLDRLNSEQK